MVQMTILCLEVKGLKRIHSDIIFSNIMFLKTNSDVKQPPFLEKCQFVDLSSGQFNLFCPTKYPYACPHTRLFLGNIKPCILIPPVYFSTRLIGTEEYFVEGQEGN